MSVPVVAAIAAKDLRQRLRDRSALVLGFAAPLAIAALMSLAFGGVDRFHVTVGYVSADRGAAAAGLHRVLTAPELRATLTVRDYPTAADARRALDRRAVQAVVAVPAGLSAAVGGTGTARVEVLSIADYRLSGQVVGSVVERFLARLNADRLAVATAVLAGSPPAGAGRLAHEAAGTPLPVTLTDRAGSGSELKTISYYAPAMGIFFVLFAIGFGSRGWFLERSAGTLDRMAAAPVRRRTLLLGKSLATFGYAVASLGTTLVVSALAFGAGWGNPLAVGILCVAVSLSVVALTALVMTLARTERQAEGVASILTFALALAGGNFVLSSTAPAVLRRLALWTPNGWALRGFTDLATGSTATATVVAPVLGIVAFTAAVTLATVLAARRAAP